LLAVLVSSRLRVVGPRHASETRQLPSKPCRPLRLYFNILYKDPAFGCLSVVGLEIGGVQEQPWRFDLNLLQVLTCKRCCN
jgi:hypothetical protein